MRKNKIIKGYKMFNHDWTCQGFKYKVGKTYKIEGKPELCKKGFHFCEKLEDCFRYYDCVTWNHIAEVEALGDIIRSEEDSKCVTNKIKIVREIRFDELKDVYELGGVNWSDGVNYSCDVNNSCGVNRSCGANNSNGINASDGVNNSSGVNRSYGVNCSSGVNWSSGVNGSSGVDGSNGVNCSYGVNCSSGVNLSNGVYNSFGVYRSDGVSNALFCADKEPEYILFNQKISKERFDEVCKKLLCFLKDWRPSFNNMPELYDESGKEWSKTPIPLVKGKSKKDAWKDMPKEAINYLKSLPEFDAEIFEKVTGIEV